MNNLPPQKLPPIDRLEVIDERLRSIEDSLRKLEAMDLRFKDLANLITELFKANARLVEESTRVQIDHVAQQSVNIIAKLEDELFPRDLPEIVREEDRPKADTSKIPEIPAWKTKDQF